MPTRSAGRWSAGPLVSWKERRAAGLVEVGLHLARHDAGQRRLPQPREAAQDQVIQRLAPAARGAQRETEVLDHAGLADELVERARSERDLEEVLAALGCGVYRRRRRHQQTLPQGRIIQKTG
jgi:hypothetical protein